jgi:hypothetical protein
MKSIQTGGKTPPQRDGVGSSETIRKTPFQPGTDFQRETDFTNSPRSPAHTHFRWDGVKSHLPQHINSYPHHFLEWFVGFTEGDGSFIISRGRLFFSITQKDGAFLRRLRTLLGFGNICADKKYPGIERYTVTRRDQVKILIHLFNGNLLLKRSAKRFALWLGEYNRITGEEIPLLDPPEPFLRVEPVLRVQRTTPHLGGGGGRESSLLWNTAWLAGFTDAEGCFTGSFSNSKRRIVLRFILDQTDELELFLHLRQILGRGSISPRKWGERGVHYRYEVESVEVLGRLADYFSRRGLRTKKRVAFLRWRKVLNLLPVLQKELVQGGTLPPSPHPLAGTEKRMVRIRRLLREINGEGREEEDPPGGSKGLKRLKIESTSN